MSATERRLRARWQELHTGDIDAVPSFKPVSAAFPEFVGRAELRFEPTETHRPRPAADLSDGQRSLLHLALTAATLDLEREIVAGTSANAFRAPEIGLPNLTILAVEEPENSLAPFFLSRIVGQMLELGRDPRAQMIRSSHAPSILGRVEPSAVRHFRLQDHDRTALVNRISLPADSGEAGKYVRQAVRTYPELYFARFVVLGEGDSEEIAIPILAGSRDLPIDRSFVAVVPLGGRHVNHLWKLLDQLQIPYATLLDLDRGRRGGGADRIRLICDELAVLGVSPASGTDALDLPEDGNVDAWIAKLAEHDVYFSQPLDLDWSLMTAYWSHYARVEPGRQGPDASDATVAVLGKSADTLADATYDGCDERLRWYRYLFLGRSKPSTHIRVLSAVEPATLKLHCPPELVALIERVRGAVQ